jgi:hypothetical protein
MPNVCDRSKGFDGGVKSVWQSTTLRCEAAPMALDPKEICAIAAKAIIEATRDLGSRRTDEPDLVALGWGDLFARTVVLQLHEPAGGVFLALGIEVTGGEFSRPMRDYSMGGGPTIDAAINSALQAWLNGPYAMLRDALGDAAVQYHYRIDQQNNATGETTQWVIFESPLQLGGDEASREPLHKAISAKPLFVRFAEKSALPPLEPNQVHWLKVHAARDVGGGSPLNECIFDSAAWPTGQQLLAEFEWPSLEAQQTFRQYWIFLVN